MTHNLVLHVDGSRVLSADRNSQGTGWAVVACHDDALQEAHGGIAEGRHSQLGGYHEHIAFVHGVLYAHQNGFDFRNVTLVCDDDIFGHAQTVLHAQNYLVGRAEGLMARLRWTVKHCFDPGVTDLVLHAFNHARILKVKGHKREVYQERADYLARHAARRASGLALGAALSFEDWLQQGIAYYDSSEGPRKVWHAPFLQLTAQEPELALAA